MTLSIILLTLAQPPIRDSTAGKISNDEGFLNGHAGVVYSPWENGNIYVSYSTSSNPTGEQIDAFTNCAYGGLYQNSATGAFPKPDC